MASTTLYTFLCVCVALRQNPDLALLSILHDSWFDVI